MPAIPPELAATAAAAVRSQDRAWRFLQAGDFRNADREIELLLRANAAFFPGHATAGYVELARGQAPAALGRFDRALELRRDYVPALVGRGEALERLNRQPDALAAFEAALAADPSLVDVRRRVDVLRFRELQESLAAARQAAGSGQNQEAVRLYQQAIARSPESAFLYRELGLVERKLGNADAALEHFRAAVKLDPADAASLGDVAAILEARGDLDGALRAYDEALALEPNPDFESRREAVRERVELARLPAEYRAIETASEITRADLAALIGVRLSAILQSARTPDAVVITDVRTSWAEPWIMSVARASVMEPYENHTFQPRALIQRIDLARAVSRLLPRVASAAQLKAWQSARVRFRDLLASHLVYPAASAAVSAGILSTGADGSFRPFARVSGAEALAAIGRIEAMAPPSANRTTNRR
jgi:tetratricopeptide (TPR) repeat protein